MPKKRQITKAKRTPGGKKIYFKGRGVYVYKPVITTLEIKKFVTKFFEISMADISAKKRKMEIVRPRMIAVWLRVKENKAQYGEPLWTCIKKYDFMILDHPAIISAFKTVENLMETNPDFKRKMEFIIQEWNNKKKKQYP